VAENGLEERVTVYHSDNLDGIPSSEQWDLVVGNPPHFSDISPGELRFHDERWSLHRSFFAAIGSFLKPGGIIVLLENNHGSDVPQHDRGSRTLHRIRTQLRKPAHAHTRAYTTSALPDAVTQFLRGLLPPANRLMNSQGARIDGLLLRVSSKRDCGCKILNRRRFLVDSFGGHNEINPTIEERTNALAGFVHNRLFVHVKARIDENGKAALPLECVQNIIIKLISCLR
jgi:hypothetical protein